MSPGSAESARPSDLRTALRSSCREKGKEERPRGTSALRTVGLDPADSDLPGPLSRVGGVHHGLEGLGLPSQTRKWDGRAGASGETHQRRHLEGRCRDPALGRRKAPQGGRLSACAPNHPAGVARNRLWELEEARTSRPEQKCQKVGAAEP